ncbi:MAG TPA: hypothetical protein PLI59_11440, partial [Candidatus Obscuribacter sp.]|nr:hypothetical protein [Candidatus Obscuribacter sp.]
QEEVEGRVIDLNPHQDAVNDRPRFGDPIPTIRNVLPLGKPRLVIGLQAPEQAIDRSQGGEAELVSRGKGVQGTTSTASASSPNEARIKESLKAAGLDGHRMVDKVGDDLNYMQRMGLDVNSLRAELKAAEQAMDKDPAAGMKALRQIKEKMYAAAQNAGPRHVPGGQYQGPNGMPGGQPQGQMPPGGQYPPMH